jgi:hypothetical protein
MMQTTVQRWWDDDSISKEPNLLNRNKVAEFVDAPIPRIGEHVYTHDPMHEWIVLMVRYNIEPLPHGFVVDVQLKRLW